MIKFALSSVSTLSLLASLVLLWQSDFFPEQLPPGIAAWVLAFFSLFHEPFTALCLYLLTVAIIAASWCITELLLSLVFSIVSAVLAFLCLLGFLSVHFAPLRDWVQALSR